MGVGLRAGLGFEVEVVMRTPWRAPHLAQVKVQVRPEATWTSALL